MDITPQTDPELFNEVQVGKHTYYVFNDAVCGAIEMLEDAYKDAYYEANPEARGKAFDGVKYQAWKDANPAKLDRAAARTLFFSKDDAPLLEGAQYQRLSQSKLVKALSFFAEERHLAELAQRESIKST